MDNHTDVVIIGAGPVGLFAIFELGLLNIKCHVIDNLDKPGGQCAELYPEKPIFDIPSRVSITGQELTQDLFKQSEPFEPVFHLSQQVEAIEKIENSLWKVTTNQGEVIKAKCIVIAAGAGSFVPRKPTLLGINRFEEQNVFYSIILHPCEIKFSAFLYFNSLVSVPFEILTLSLRPYFLFVLIIGALFGGAAEGFD